jgi:hypothetical protein
MVCPFALIVPPYVHEEMPAIVWQPSTMQERLRAAATEQRSVWLRSEQPPRLDRSAFRLVNTVTSSTCFNSDLGLFFGHCGPLKHVLVGGYSVILHGYSHYDR